MNKKMSQLKNERATLLDTATKYSEENKIEEFNAIMKEVDEKNEEINRLQKIDIERGKFEESDKVAMDAYQAMAKKKEDARKEKNLDDILSSNEYARAFTAAIRDGVSCKNVNDYGEKFNPLRNALKIVSEGTPKGKDGGFLVPKDVSNEIHEFRRSVLNLADYVNVENVTTPTGSRPYDTKPTKGFTKIGGELRPVPEDDQPVFSQIEYNTDTYGLFIQLSQQLVQDEDANLLSYLARWFGIKQVITENQLILDALNKLRPLSTASDSPFDAIKTALNVKLDPAISERATFLTNQSGFNELDLEKDTAGNYLLNDVVRNRTATRIAGDRIVVQSNQFMHEPTNAAPLYIGDFKEFLTLFRRKYLELDSTAIGGNAWRNYGYEIRGITRLGVTIFDSKAAVKLNIPLAESGDVEVPEDPDVAGDSDEIESV